MSRERQQPFKSDYAKDSSAPTVGREEAIPPVVPLTYVKGTETPAVGKPHGNDKPYRVKIRGKISRD